MSVTSSILVDIWFERARMLKDRESVRVATGRGGEKALQHAPGGFEEFSGFECCSCACVGAGAAASGSAGLLGAPLLADGQL